MVSGDVNCEGTSLGNKHCLSILSLQLLTHSLRCATQKKNQRHGENEKEKDNRNEVVEEKREKCFQISILTVRTRSKSYRHTHTVHTAYRFVPISV